MSQFWFDQVGWVTDNVGKDALIKRWKSKKRLFELDAPKEPEEIWLDGGGMIHVDEPKVKFEANGVKFGTYARQLPYILAAVKSKKESSKFPGCVTMGGRWVRYIVSFETRDAMVRIMEELEIQYGHEIREFEEKVTAVGQGADVIMMGKCSCQSGKTYVECCRKSEKTP